MHISLLKKEQTNQCHLKRVNGFDVIANKKLHIENQQIRHNA